jgi:hypothetical protein
LQAGKWRRQLVVPHIDACTTVDLDQVLGKDQLRLPKKSSEGDMPLIAFTSGCDPAECFLRHIGIDDSEFVAPDSPTGHVHFYTGQDANGTGEASSITGGNTSADTYTWWTDVNNLKHYDIVFNACECNPNDRGAAAYPAMHDYLQAGGRLFTTHYYGNWFMPNSSACSTCNGPADFASVAQWSPWNNTGSSEQDAIDQSFPKGQAFAQWLQTAGATTSLGQISLVDTRDDVSSILPAGCTNGSCLSTQWVVHPGDNHPRYLSFNTPVGMPAAQQCGRAVLSDVHLSGTSNDSVFPNECANQDPSYTVNEKALEFLFFDLSSCVQDDALPPTTPPPQQ